LKKVGKEPSAQQRKLKGTCSGYLSKSADENEGKSGRERREKDDTLKRSSRQCAGGRVERVNIRGHGGTRKSNEEEGLASANEKPKNRQIDQNSIAAAYKEIRGFTEYVERTWPAEGGKRNLREESAHEESTKDHLTSTPAERVIAKETDRETPRPYGRKSSC